MGNKHGSCLLSCFHGIYARTFCGRVFNDFHNRSFHKDFGPDAVHSRLYPYIFNDLMILPLPVGYTNLTYLVADLKCTNFVLVDVGDASVLQYVTSQPDAILTTHKHWDHSGGNKTMRRTYPKLKVYGGEKDGVPSRTHDVKDGEVLRFGRLQFTAIWTPGHTRGHIVWRLHGDSFQCQDHLFTGDHVFVALVGHWFEGTLVEMVKSMDSLKILPMNSLIWPGHTSDGAGLKMTLLVEPDNNFAWEKLNWLKTMERDQMPTCPSSLGEEASYNLFMRADDQQLQQALGVLDTILEQKLNQDDIIVLCSNRVQEIVEKNQKVKEEMEKANKRDYKKRKINNKWMRQFLRKRRNELRQELHRMELTATEEERLREMRRRETWEEDTKRIREEVETEMRVTEQKKKKKRSSLLLRPLVSFSHRKISGMMLPHLIFVQRVARYSLPSTRKTRTSAKGSLSLSPKLREPKRPSYYLYQSDQIDLCSYFKLSSSGISLLKQYVEP